jgi:type I restriction enzyme M protein
MAQRPVYLTRPQPPYCFPWNAEFVYNSGFAPSQKQKNITAIHAAFSATFPELKVLEISSKSMQPGGVELSAFHLPKYVPSLDKSIPVENIYQAGKVFAHGGPYTDLLHVTPREAKLDERLQTSGPLTGFRFEGQDFPLKPITIFYDYLYINALLENEKLAQVLLQYDAFTDIEFNPQKSINCQAKAAALFVALHRLNKLDAAKDFDSFRALLLAAPAKSAAFPMSAAAAPVKATAPVKPAVPTPPAEDICPGEVRMHKVWGPGTVTRVTPTVISLHFDSVGDKNLGRAWVAANCPKA